MARRSRGQRETPDFANLEGLLDPVYQPGLLQLSPYPLPLLEDRRQYHPEAAERPPLSFNQYTEFEIHEPSKTSRRNFHGARTVRKPIARATKARNGLSAEIAFRDVNRVAICVRRKRRREVIHALGKAGRRTRRTRRYNTYSQVRC